MKQLIVLACLVLLFSCDRKEVPTEDQFTTQFELFSIGYYDHFQSFDPPLTLDISSEPTLLDLSLSDSIAVKFYTTQRAIDYHNGNPPVIEFAGSLIFLERVNGEWNSIVGDESYLDSIQLNQWISQEIFMSNCDSEDDYFSVDFRYQVAQN